MVGNKQLNKRKNNIHMVPHMVTPDTVYARCLQKTFYEEHYLIVHKTSTMRYCIQHVAN